VEGGFFIFDQRPLAYERACIQLYFRSRTTPNITLGVSMKTRFAFALMIFAGCACVGRGEVEDIKKSQEKILAKLDEIAKARPQAANPAPRQGPDPAKVYAMPIGTSPVKGSDSAWVTIVEVSDFQCPFCSRVTPTLKEITEKYGNDVRFVFKHNPLSFHQRAMPAAIAAECAHDQNKFWQMHDKLFENQKDLSDEAIEKYAQEVGLDIKKYKECFASGKHKARIDADLAQAADLGTRGTPSFYINGRFLSGAQPFPSFQALIDEELKKAKESGISKKDYYAKAVLEKGEKKAM
jgi:protein-disulfide isomerase